MVRKFLPIWIIFYVFFCNAIKINDFCVVLFHLICSLLHATFLLVLYAFVPIGSMDCIPLSLLALSVIWLTSLNTLYLSLLNLCFDFSINSLFFKLFMIFSKTMLIFFLTGSFYSQDELLSNSFVNCKFKFSFYKTLFRAFCFFYLSRCCLLDCYMILLLMRLTVALFFCLIYLSLIQ